MSQANIQRLQRQWDRLDNLEIDEAIKQNLSTKAGRRFLWWLLQVGKINIQPFTANALSTSFACGEMNVGQRILDRIISVDPAGYARMMTEQADEHRDRTNQYASALGSGAGGYHPAGDNYAPSGNNDDAGDYTPD